MVKINLVRICLLILLFILIGIVVVYYRECEIENFYEKKVLKEYLENPPGEQNGEEDKKLCDVKCNLDPIKTQINMVNSRIDTIENNVLNNESLIKKNIEYIKTVKDTLDEAESSLEDAATETPPPSDQDKPPNIDDIISNSLDKTIPTEI